MSVLSISLQPSLPPYEHEALRYSTALGYMYALLATCGLAPPTPSLAGPFSSSSDRKLEPREPSEISGNVLPWPITVESDWFPGVCISAAI